MTSAGWGAGAWGSAPWGIGSDPLAILSALAVRENVVRVTFNQAVYFSGILDPGDASNPARFVVRGISGIGLDGVPVYDVRAVTIAEVGDGGAVLDVTVDRPFAQYPCVYRVSANALKSVTGRFIIAGSSAGFDGVQAGVREFALDQILATSDFANPQNAAALQGLPNSQALTSAALGTFRPDGTGDYAKDSGLVSYNKRVIRRVMANKDGFAHLKGYGLGPASLTKRTGKPGLRELLASDAEDQIRQEPETLSVAVRVVSVGAKTVYQVRAQTKYGPSNLDIPTANKV
jgi:hypothetical protein